MAISTLRAKASASKPVASKASASATRKAPAKALTTAETAARIASAARRPWGAVGVVGAVTDRGSARTATVRRSPAATDGQWTFFAASLANASAKRLRGEPGTVTVKVTGDTLAVTVTRA